MTVLAPEAQTRGPADDGDSFSHYYCCNQDLSLCGTDISQLPEIVARDQLTAQWCVVCDLTGTCARCGARLAC